MNPKERLDAGDLTGALQALNQSVKARPTDGQLRVFLFEVLCFLGDFERAERQLDVLGTQAHDPGDELAIQVHRQLLTAERRRQQVFAGSALPKFMIPPPPSVEQYAIVLARLAQGQPCAAAYEEAEEATPPASGTVGGTSFSHVRDADDRIAPILEVFYGNDYLWVPFEQIRSIEIVPPKRLRELLWVPATIELENQPRGEVFVPALYVNSHLHPNDAVKLGRMTEWAATQDQIVTGAGQRVLLADDEEHALLGIRQLQIGTVVGQNAS